MRDIFVRAAKTFAQAFAASLLTVGFTDLNGLQASLLAGVAGVLSIIQNGMIFTATKNEGEE